MSAAKLKKTTSDSHAEPRSGSIGLNKRLTSMSEGSGTLQIHLLSAPAQDNDLLCFVYQNCQMSILTIFLSDFKGACKSLLTVNKIHIYFKKCICLKTFRRECKWKLFKWRTMKLYNKQYDLSVKWNICHAGFWQTQAILIAACHKRKVQLVMHSTFH